jgi:Flp pilus assembly protein TadG
MSQRLRRERGDATVEAVLAVPVLLLVILTIIQFALWYHASHTAKAAAQEGVRAARVEGGTATDGRARATDFMARAVPTLIEGVTITASRDDDHTRVEVRGTLRSLVPGLHLTVAAEADSPVERFRPDT